MSLVRVQPREFRVFAEVVEHSDLARRIHESFLNARTTVGDYLMLNDVDYINKRNKVLGA
ncbi:MAG: hypothetical protein EBT93_11215 [Alphaproteobacteria bacterium]|nr:hypothetical protein [Alphaproteobacteria bacterium]